ncbi:hypothetical protein [Komagataeibacter sp. FXV3]|uniref:hypothetical protein n=1 Tax=Komagataeibacter sp. FXV3 TaxID=2608998 RepID=UPI00187BB07F|nr:hypothetical protein [Komagataeibacter sp. FXV3]MBE7731235.1 hypothetical protein [Komagataeibacter sp. FXV3]
MTRIILHADGRAPITIELDGTGLQPLHFHLGSDFGQTETNDAAATLPEAAAARRWRLKKALPALIAGGLAAILIIGTRQAMVSDRAVPDTGPAGMLRPPAILPPLSGAPMTDEGAPGVRSTYVPGARMPVDGNVVDNPDGHPASAEIDAARRIMTQRPVVTYPQPPGGAQTAPTAPVSPTAPTAPVAPTIDTGKSPFGLED